MNEPSEVGEPHVQLSPNTPEAWPQIPIGDLFAIPRRDFEPLQLQAMQHRFDQMRGSIAALERLVDREGVREIKSIGDALPYYFDHRVYKSYPLSIIEKRDFKKLTTWLNRLTTHDLLKVDLTGLRSLDDWITRLDESGMIIGHSTGTTGKLSFIPRSRVEWDAWQAAYYEGMLAATGIDGRHEHLINFAMGYRGGHQMAVKMIELFAIPAAGGDDRYISLYQNKLSSDLLSMAGRLQAADDRGELAHLGIDPVLLEQREQMIAQAKRRDQDLLAFFKKMIEEYRGQRVMIGGTGGDLIRVAQAGASLGLTPAFASDSIIMTGGGLKGFKDAPADWEGYIKDYFKVSNLSAVASMSEVMGVAPRCSHGFYHYPPHTVVSVLDADARELPREGQQTGRLALFDLMAQTYWGGFISGDRVTIDWNDDCPCGWKGPRMHGDIQRFAEMEGGDDKITCAGTQKAYNEFLDFVTNI